MLPGNVTPTYHIFPKTLETEIRPEYEIFKNKIPMKWIISCCSVLFEYIFVDFNDVYQPSNHAQNEQKEKT